MDLRVCCYIFLWLWIAHQLAWFLAGGPPILRVAFGSGIVALDVVWVAADIVEMVLWIEQ